MREQFYIVLSSNNSMYVFPENKTTHFTTQLPQNIYLHGEWSVALYKIQIPHTFQHISIDNYDGMVCVKTIFSSNDLRHESTEKDVAAHLSPGIYTDMENLLQEINNLSNMKNHLQFKIQRGGFIEIERICQDTCDINFHSLKLSEKLLRIIGFENRNLEKIKDTVVGQRPADLISGLPSIIRVYSDIYEPYITGDVHTPLLRFVPLNMNEYKYGSIEIKNFTTPMYIPLLSTSFQSITIDIKDQDGNPIAFDYGTLTVTLHFKRTT